MRQGARNAKPDANVKIAPHFYAGKGFCMPTPTARLEYLEAISQCCLRTAVTGAMVSDRMHLEPALKRLSEHVKEAHAAGGKVIFVGNGGSAAIASHMAVDYSKNKGVRAVCLNDTAMITALGNDYGFATIFAKQIEWQGREQDVAIIVSSSGQSPSVLAAADAARERGLNVIVTLSGFDPNNKLRRRGDMNFWVPSTDYGLVEISHLALLHSVASTP